MAIMLAMLGGGVKGSGYHIKDFSNKSTEQTEEAKPDLRNWGFGNGAAVDAVDFCNNGIRGFEGLGYGCGNDDMNGDVILEGSGKGNPRNAKH
jgi:hypothetical protein